MTRVLLVDDHALIRRGMRDALADDGVQVVGEAACWDELDPLLGAQACDVLLLDIQLPGPSGLDILERLAARPARARARWWCPCIPRIRTRSRRWARAPRLRREVGRHGGAGRCHRPRGARRARGVDRHRAPAGARRQRQPAAARRTNTCRRASSCCWC
jgi:hypothetical protein